CRPCLAYEPGCSSNHSGHDEEPTAILLLRNPQRHTESFTTFLMQGAGRRMRGNLLHVSFNRIRLKDKNMQQIKVLQRPLRV
ncbi:hypothetical protein CN170_22715, partial [Sinorhizobium meliloti]